MAKPNYTAHIEQLEAVSNPSSYKTDCMIEPLELGEANNDKV